MSSEKRYSDSFKQQIPVVHKSGLHMTVEVHETPLEKKAGGRRTQKQQMLFLFSFFLLLGLLILTGQVTQKTRTMASVSPAVEVNLNPEK